MSKYKVIIFDMDGVLVDTEAYYYNRRKTFLTRKGISIDHLSPLVFIGGNMKQVWHMILADDYEKWDVPALEAEYGDEAFIGIVSVKNKSGLSSGKSP